MKLRIVVLGASLVSANLLAAGAAKSDRTQKVTYYKDALPILQERCQFCHRPGEIAPMSLMSYKETRPWAKAIKDAVSTRKMPPWSADPHVGKFSNDWSLNDDQIRTLTAWVDSGALEGNASEAPAPKTFVEGWNIGKPDYTVEMPAFPIPANGTVDYQYIVLPSGLTEDKWVQAAEIRPTFRQAVHHVVVFVREKGSPWLKEAQPGVAYIPPSNEKFANTLGGGSDVMTIYTPGMAPDVWTPGMAKMIPAGADFVFQLHYTPNGKAGVDKSKLGLTFATAPVERRVISMAAIDFQLKIPPGEANSVSHARTPNFYDSTLISFFPHMHVRGKSFEYEIVMPNGDRQKLLNVPRYDFNWQFSYRLATPIDLPPGAKIECTAVFDNSPNNPANPDPKATVKWGEQTSEEMMVGFYDLAVSKDMNRRKYSAPMRKEKTGSE
jgi:hypothetical protein